MRLAQKRIERPQAPDQPAAERSSTGAGQHVEQPGATVPRKDDTKMAQPVEEPVEAASPLSPVREQAVHPRRRHEDSAHAGRINGKMMKSAKRLEHIRRAMREAERRRQYYRAEDERRQAYYAYYYEMRRRYESTHRGLLFTDIWNDRR